MTHSSAAAKQARLSDLERKMKKAASNMALADDAYQHRAMAEVFDGLRREHEALQAELEAATNAGPLDSPEEDVEAAMALLEGLGDLATDPENLESIGELFRRMDVRLFLRFRQAAWGKRTVNRVAGGVVTFGVTPPPVPLYEGPTSRRLLRALPPPPSPRGIGHNKQTELSTLDREGDSLGNVNRGERI